MIPRIVIAFWIASTFSLLAASSRVWRSADGAHQTTGELVKRDANSITIRNAEGKLIVITLNQLHADDRAWLNNQAGGKPARKPPPSNSAVFDRLVFGDTRDQVMAKLKASTLVEKTLDDTFLGRTGLNGVYHTRKPTAGLDAFLFFEWTEADTLKEVSLQTVSVPADDYQSKLEPAWKEFVELLETLYGKPVQDGALPRSESLNDGTFIPSHLWALQTGGSVLLGAAREGNQYQLIVRFTQKKIEPVRLN